MQTEKAKEKTAYKMQAAICFQRCKPSGVMAQ